MRVMEEKEEMQLIMSTRINTLAAIRFLIEYLDIIPQILPEV